MTDEQPSDAGVAILFVGLAPNWYPPNYDCGACGYATCAEFLHATKELRKESSELEFTGLPLPDPRRGRRPQTWLHHRRTCRRTVLRSGAGRDGS
jgi:hypothetical protein